MKFLDLLLICYQDLTSKKSRTLLTVIGVIVGTCAVLTMAAIGIGMKQNQDRMLSQMGDLKEIRIYNYGGGKKKIDDAMLKRWGNLPGVDIISPLYSPNNLSFRIEAKNRRFEISYLDVVGVYPEYLEKIGFEYLEKPETKLEDAMKEPFGGSKKIYVIAGEAFAYGFADVNKGGWNNQVMYEKDENGQPTKKPYVDIYRDKMYLGIRPGDGNEKSEIKRELIIGGRLKENSMKAYQSHGGAFMDIHLLKEMEKLTAAGAERKPDQGYNQVIVMVKDIDMVEAVEKAIKEEGFDTNSLAETRKSLQENREQQMQMLYSMSILALFVAAISIMNTMIMSISERTKEIGVMKVLGCYVSDIRKLFLLESGVIGFLGGTAGIVLSYLLSFLINRFGRGMVQSIGAIEGMAENTGAVCVLPISLAAAGLVFATLVGLVAGYLPANRAVKISALEAMKAG